MSVSYIQSLFQEIQARYAQLITAAQNNLSLTDAQKIELINSLKVQAKEEIIQKKSELITVIDSEVKKTEQNKLLEIENLISLT